MIQKKKLWMIENGFWGMMIAKEVDVNCPLCQGHFEWAKEALRNQCNDCPYLDCCNEKAKEESKQCGTVRFGCREYLKEKIEFVVEK